MESMNDKDAFGNARYRNHLGLWFTDSGGVRVRCFQLVDNLDNKAIASVVFHDDAEVDRIHAPRFAGIVDEWLSSLMRVRAA